MKNHFIYTMLAFLLISLSFDAKAELPEWGSVDSDFTNFVNWYIANAASDPASFSEAIGDNVGAAAGETFNIPKPGQTPPFTEAVTHVASFELDFTKSAGDGFTVTDASKFTTQKDAIQEFVDFIGQFVDNSNDGLRNPGTLDGWSAEYIQQNTAATGDIFIFRAVDNAEELPGVPLDGGLSILALAGIAFGIKRSKFN